MNNFGAKIQKQKSFEFFRKKDTINQPEILAQNLKFTYFMT